MFLLNLKASLRLSSPLKATRERLYEFAETCCRVHVEEEIEQKIFVADL